MDAVDNIMSKINVEDTIERSVMNKIQIITDQEINRIVKRKLAKMLETS